MQRNFLGWESSQAKVDQVWTGIMGSTPDGWPHIGRVPGRENQWVLAAKAVAKMVIDDSDFEDVRQEFGMPQVFATTAEQLHKVFSEVK